MGGRASERSCSMMGPGDLEEGLLEAGLAAGSGALMKEPEPVCGGPAEDAGDEEAGVVQDGDLEEGMLAVDVKSTVTESPEVPEREGDRLKDAFRSLVASTALAAMFMVSVTSTWVSLAWCSGQGWPLAAVLAALVCAMYALYTLLFHKRSVSFARKHPLSASALASLILLAFAWLAPSSGAVRVVLVTIGAMATNIVLCALIGSIKRLRSSSFQSFFSWLVGGAVVGALGALVLFLCTGNTGFLIAEFALRGVFHATRVVQIVQDRLANTTTSNDFADEACTTTLFMVYTTFVTTTLFF